MKKLLLLGCCTLFASAVVRAQSAVSSPNIQAQERMDVYQENFIYPVDNIHSYNVIFALYPRHINNEAHIILQSNDPFLCYATLTDATGKLVMTWKPEMPNTRFYKQLDLSKTAPGTYVIHVYKTGQQSELYHFDFVKQ